MKTPFFIYFPSIIAHFSGLSQDLINNITETNQFYPFIER
ncbi:hypothetical protein [Salmonella phage PHA46]